MKHRGAPRCQLLVSSPARGATARQLLVSSALLSTTAPLHNVFPSGRLYNRPNNRPSPHSISASAVVQPPQQPPLSTLYFGRVVVRVRV